jgi:hypothetical protein
MVALTRSLHLPFEPNEAPTNPVADRRSDRVFTRATVARRGQAPTLFTTVLSMFKERLEIIERSEWLTPPAGAYNFQGTSRGG